MQSRREVFTAEPELGFIGRVLARPECVLACASGRLFVSDSRGGVTMIAPDATQQRIGKSSLVPNDSLATFRTPVAGLPPVHWHWS